MTTQAPLVYAYRIFSESALCSGRISALIPLLLQIVTCTTKRTSLSQDKEIDAQSELSSPQPRPAYHSVRQSLFCVMLNHLLTTSNAIVATLTTVSGFCNLILTRWYMARFGIRFALVMQTLFPCIRNLFQIWGLSRSGWFGIVIFQVSRTRILGSKLTWMIRAENLLIRLHCTQSTQLLTIFGGGLGYLLAANSYVAAVVEPEERTAAFGILQVRITSVFRPQIVTR
jgi:hypothetical protein